MGICSGHDLYMVDLENYGHWTVGTLSSSGLLRLKVVRSVIVTGGL